MDQEARIQNALNAIRTNEVPSLRKAAILFKSLVQPFKVASLASNPIPKPTNPSNDSRTLEFLPRHPELKLKRARYLDQQCKDGAIYETLSHWFETYQRIRVSYDIAEEDVYNIDEKGLMKGIDDDAKVLTSRTDKEAYTNQPDNRE
ncbi:hypothetical protein HD806DRAFT_532049 [Xylariaceae sp. AK1471]|nr:hypothetical protein HD806DRAFT_532049 [Xylariaceae sp. AK1471]